MNSNFENETIQNTIQDTMQNTAIEPEKAPKAPKEKEGQAGEQRFLFFAAP